MSGMDTGYGHDIHDMIDQLKMPDDDGITTSSFENSKIDNNKSLTLSRKTQKRGLENESIARQFRADQFNDTSGIYSPNASGLSPYGDRHEKTLTINSLNSSAIDEKRGKIEENKHSNTPRSSHRQQYINEREYENRHKYNNDEGSIDYDDNSYDGQSPDFSNNKSRIHLTNDTMSDNFNFNCDTQDIIQSEVDRENEAEYEEEESEYDDDSELGYRQDTLGNSLIDQTKSQFINGRELTGALYKQSLGENTNEDPNNHIYYSDEDNEGEESEQSKDQSMTYESEISGMDSLSRTDNSRWSKNKFKHSQRYNRSGKQRITADFSRGQNSNSQYDESNSQYKGREATNSIGIRTRKSNNQESYYGTDSPSMESWAAMTPKDGGVRMRQTKESQNQSHINLNDKSNRSPEERSLIINSNSVVSRGHNRGYDESNQKHLRSNLFESSQGADPQTEIRGQRKKGITSDSRTSNKKYKKTPINKSVKGLPRDHELEDVLSNDQDENTKEVIQRLKENDSHPYVFTSESEQANEEMHNFEKLEYRSLKIEHHKLRREFKKSQIQIHNYQKQIEDYKAELANLSSAYVSIEQKMLNYEDELHMLSNFKQGLDTKKINKLMNEDLKRARKEISNLKQINQSVENDNHHLKDRLSEFNEMEEYYKNEYDQLETKFATARIKIESLEKNLSRVGKLESELQNAKDEYLTVINQANNEIGKREDVIGEFKDLIRKKDNNIELLSKQINDNKHLVENDQAQTQQLYNEIQDYKARISDLENELEQYKEMPRNVQMAHEKADYDKEISKIEHMYKNKLNSAYEQIDDWKHKFKNEQEQKKLIEKQLQLNLENSNEKETNETVGGVENSKYLEVVNQLEQAREELETLELMKQELDKARKLNDELKEKLNDYANQQSEGNIPDYWQCRIDEKDNDLQRLSDELVLLQKRYELLESQKWDLSHEKNELLSTISDMRRAIKDREQECDRLNKHRMDAENNAEMLKEASKETLKEKRELERKLNEITKHDNYEKSKSTHDYEALRKESNSLIEYILTLEFASDEEFEKLLKNQSYTSEFDRAKKHLKNQKDIVNMITERLENEYNALIVENDNYKQQLEIYDSQNGDYEDLKEECQKWKQNYDRLTLAMKTLNGSEDKDLKEIMADYKKMQDKLTELQKENARKEDLLKESQELIEK